MKDVTGKVAFVTGGSSGIGLGIAKAFVDAGMKVVLGYQTKNHLEQAMVCLQSARDRVYAIEVDVTDRPGMEKAAAETVRAFGQVHVLVNNAGVAQHGPLSEATYQDWDWVMSVNTDGVYNGVHAFLPLIQSHGEGGHIVTTSSILGLVGSANSTLYCASKYAVVGLMEALRAELAGQDIGVSVFCPGPVRSNIIDPQRNRPPHLSDTKSKPDPQKMAEWRALLDQYADRIMDPLEAGRLVLRGLRSNDLYILSHPEFEPMMQARSEALSASIPRDLVVSQARVNAAPSIVSSAIYVLERDRKLHEG